MSFLDAVLDRPAFSRVPELFLVGRDDPSFVRRGKRALQALLVLALAGGLAVLVALVKGHHVMGTSSEMPWGVLIATYVFFVAMTSGLCLVSSLGHVFGFTVFEPLAKKAIFMALVTLVVGFSVIGSELERPFLLMKWAVLSPNPSSPIWWMGTLYGLYTVVLAFELWFLVTEDHRWAKVAGTTGVVMAVAAHTNLGAVFGLSHARPFWAGPLVPIYFLAWSLVMGASLLLLLVYFTDYFGNARTLRPQNEPLYKALRQLLALFLGVVVVITAWRMLANLSAPHSHEAEVTMAYLTGPLMVSFWLGEVFFGLAMPLVLLLSEKRHSPRAVAFAAALPVLGVFIMRFNFVVAGQMFSLKPVVGRMGETLAYAPPFKGNVAGFLPYTPSLTEALIVAGAIAAATLLVVGGLRTLKLTAEVGHE